MPKLGYRIKEEVKLKISETNKKKGIRPPSFLGAKHSEESKLKMREARLGSKHPLWKGGVTPTNNLIRKSARYKAWRKSVFERDNYTCVECGTGGSIQADHIKRFSEYPELRFSLENGRTLCIPCHKKTETYGRPVLTT